MKDDEWIRVIQELVSQTKRERISLAAMGEFIGGWGFLREATSNASIQARGVARLMKRVLRDEELQDLLQAIQEYRYLTAAMELVNTRIPLINQFCVEPWNHYHKRKQGLEEKIKELRDRADAKVGLIRQLAVILKDAKYEEEIELPDVEPDFPALG